MAQRLFEFWEDDTILKLHDKLQGRELDQGGLEDMTRSFPGLSYTKQFRISPEKLYVELNEEIRLRRLKPHLQVDDRSATVVFRRRRR